MSFQRASPDSPAFAGTPSAQAEALFKTVVSCLAESFPDPAHFGELARAAARAALACLGSGPEAASLEPACRAAFLRELASRAHHSPRTPEWNGELGRLALFLVGQPAPLTPVQAMMAFRRAPPGALAALLQALKPSPADALEAAFQAARAGDGPAASLFLSDPSLMARPSAERGGSAPIAALLDHGHGAEALMRASALALQYKNLDVPESAGNARWAFRDLPAGLASTPFFQNLPQSIAAWDPSRDASASEMARWILLGAPLPKAKAALAALRQACRLQRAPAPEIPSELALALIFLPFDSELADRAELAIEFCPSAGAEHARQLLCRFPLEDSDDALRVLELALSCSQKAFDADPSSLLQDSRRLDHPAQFSADLAELALRSVYYLAPEPGSPAAQAAQRLLELCFQAGLRPHEPLPGRRRSLHGKLAASGKKHMKAWRALCESIEISQSVPAPSEPGSGAPRFRL